MSKPLKNEKTFDQSPYNPDSVLEDTSVERHGILEPDDTIKTITNDEGSQKQESD